MNSFIIEERAEPPKIYIDNLEKSKTLEFVTYTTKLAWNKKVSETMTEQEAIVDLKGENKILSQYAESKFQKEIFTKRIERNNIAIKALEKQIARKPIRKPNLDWTNEEVTCPTCNRFVSEFRNQYCDCGQKLDWGEEE